MKEIIDKIRLLILLLIEKYSKSSIYYNEEYGETEFISNIQPLISSYLNYFKNKKKEVICKINGHQFSKLETIVLHLFTADGSSYINNELSSPRPKINTHKKIIIKVFDNVLKKIERTDNKYVFRMDYNANDNIENVICFFNLQKNKIINIPWFLSTTEHSALWGNKIVWKIHIINNQITKARHFYPYVGNHGDEKEIRFERDTKLKIIEVEKFRDVNSQNYYVIHMEESYSIKYDANLNYGIYSIDCNPALK